MSAVQFSSCVEYGLGLSKRILYGKESAPAAAAMSRSSSQSRPAMSRSSSRSRPVEHGYLPESLMVYAAVSDPSIVDNPDIPSYQPYVYGRCEPPALIPLHMHSVALEIESYLDTAFVTVTGNWRVHCISAGKKCDCRVAVPMGEKGSLLGVEVEVAGSSYRSQLITVEGQSDSRKVVKDGYFLKRHTYTFKVPQVEGGSFISLKIRWSQKLIYHDGKFSLIVPFNFPAYVNPLGNKIMKGEKVSLSVNMGAEAEILCQTMSHPLKVVKRQSGKLSFSYEANVAAWSSTDFSFSYSVNTKDVYGAVFLQSPTLRDFDDREMFCLYMIPGTNQTRKVFKKEVIFVIDKSGSMAGDPLENAKSVVLASLSNLNQDDTFNIIAFNSEVHLFSSSMELATNEALLKAKNWLSTEVIADGGTNIILPLKQAMKLLAKTTDTIPFIFLITDGAVEDEREICNMIKGYLTSGKSTSPRISTFGIGLYCNHYFLQMLAQIGRGYYDAAYDGDSIDYRVQRLFTRASSVILANITVDAFEHLDSLELFPSHMLDLSCGSPLVISGRYEGSFPPSIKVSGTLADMSNFSIDLKVQRSKDFPLDRVLAKRHIDMLTAQAWLLGSKELEDKVSKISNLTGVPSEYTSMTLLRTEKGKKLELTLTQEVYKKVILRTKSESSSQKDIILGCLGVGFGNLAATFENKAPATDETKPSVVADVLVKAASTCCTRVLDRICCMCFIRTCTHVNNQCAIFLTQLCTALCCCECLNCCFELFS